MYHQSLVIRGWRWNPGSPVCWVSTPPTKPRPGSSSHCVLAFTATVVTDRLRQFWAGLFSVSSGVLNCGCFSRVPRNPLIRPSLWVPATVTKFPVSALFLLIGHNFTSKKLLSCPFSSGVGLASERLTSPLPHPPVLGSQLSRGTLFLIKALLYLS